MREELVWSTLFGDLVCKALIGLYCFYDDYICRARQAERSSATQAFYRAAIVMILCTFLLSGDSLPE